MRRAVIIAVIMAVILGSYSCQQEKVDLTPLEQKISNIEKNLKGLETRIKGLEEQPLTTPEGKVNLAPINKKLSSLEKEIKSLTGTVNEIDRSLKSLKKAVDLLKKKIG